MLLSSFLSWPCLISSCTLWPILSLLDRRVIWGTHFSKKVKSKYFWTFLLYNQSKSPKLMNIVKDSNSQSSPRHMFETRSSESSTYKYFTLPDPPCPNGPNQHRGLDHPWKGSWFFCVKLEDEKAQLRQQTMLCWDLFKGIYKDKDRNDKYKYKHKHKHKDTRSSDCRTKSSNVKTKRPDWGNRHECCFEIYSKKYTYTNTEKTNTKTNSKTRETEKARLRQQTWVLFWDVWPEGRGPQPATHPTSRAQIHYFTSASAFPQLFHSKLASRASLL